MSAMRIRARAAVGAAGLLIAAVVSVGTTARAAEECEQAHTCTVDSPTRSCLFPFTVADGEIVRVTVRERDDTLTAQWRLLTASGTSAPSCGSLRPGRGSDCGPLPAGEYRIEVGAAAGTGAAGVHLQRLTRCTTTELRCEQPLEDEIVPPEESDLFRFAAAEGEVVRLTVRKLTGPLVAEWRLLTIDGVPAESCGSFRRALAADCGPLGAGDYQLQVVDETARNVGTYAVDLLRLTAEHACDVVGIRCDDTVQAEIDPPTDADLFRFTVEEGEAVRVTVDELSGALRAEWRLLTADGLPAPVCSSLMLARSADCGPLPAGDYLIYVRDDDARDTGAYELTLLFLVNLCSNCGNGLVTDDEECDPPGGCCTSSCRIAPVGFVCRPPAAECDIPEVCDGESSVCPVDRAAPAGVVCRPPVDLCDQPETCTGRSVLCPLDVLKPAGAICRPAVGPCDLPEICSGRDAACPAVDAKRQTVCRPAIGPCDIAERCDGISDECPHDGVAPPGFVCRPAAHPCDVAETCSGISPTCPPNLLPAGECGNGCPDAGEQCGESGMAPCPAGEVCVACRCLACAPGLIACPAAPGPDGRLEVAVSVDVGGRALGDAGFTLVWDASLLAFESIGGGETPEFAGPATCSLEPEAGRARCTALQRQSADRPTGVVEVARVRFAALGSSAARPDVGLAVDVLVDTTGDPIAACPLEASCAVPECDADEACDAGDACSEAACVEGTCQRGPRGGLEGADCRLAELAGALRCQGVPIGGSFSRVVGRTVTKARRLLQKAVGRPERRVVRLVRRVDRQLAALQRRLARDHRIPADCRTEIGELVGERRRLLAALVSR
jgi:hypothetical protein